MVEWRPVIGFEGFYEASSCGDVRSIPREIKCRAGVMRRADGVVLHQSISNSGYKTVGLTRGGERYTKSVHRIVLAAFCGAPRGRCCRHLNGVRTDNRIENLAWGTWSQNQIDRAEHGTSIRGERSHMARLTEELVRRLRRGELTPAECRDRFGINYYTACSARSGRTWGWMK